MLPVIVQHCTVEQNQLFAVSSARNRAYADRLGLVYDQSGGSRLCPERSLYWEKIARLRMLLPTLAEGATVLWLDADTVFVKDESFASALPEHGLLGMVQLRGGVNKMTPGRWFNVGVIVMKNVQMVRDFLDRVWARNQHTDEAAVVHELRENAWQIAPGFPVISLDPKWNTWHNNDHLCKSPVIRGWHGACLADKLKGMQSYLAKLS